MQRYCQVKLVSSQYKLTASKDWGGGAGNLAQ